MPTFSAVAKHIRTNIVAPVLRDMPNLLRNYIAEPTTCPPGRRTLATVLSQSILPRMSPAIAVGRAAAPARTNPRVPSMAVVGKVIATAKRSATRAAGAAMSGLLFGAGAFALAPAWMSGFALDGESRRPRVADLHEGEHRRPRWLFRNSIDSMSPRSTSGPVSGRPSTPLSQTNWYGTGAACRRKYPAHPVLTMAKKRRARPRLLAVSPWPFRPRSRT